MSDEFSGTTPDEEVAPSPDPAIKTPQRPYQERVYLDHRNDRFFALWWEMGLGKTKLMLDVISHLHVTGEIDAVLVVGPKSVYMNWLDVEVPIHLATRHMGLQYDTAGANSVESQARRNVFLDKTFAPGILRFATMSYSSLSVTDTGLRFAQALVSKFRCLVALDESSDIANPSTARARACYTIGDLASYRWIMTGTPVAKSPFAVWSQMRFLSQSFWERQGLRSYHGFKAAFAVFRNVRAGRRTYQERTSFRSLDRLQGLIAPHSSRLLKEDSGVDLPPKIYTTRVFELTEDQQRLYDQVRRQMIAQLDEEDAAGAKVQASIAIVRLARLHQIACGFVTAESFGFGLPGVDEFAEHVNERLRELLAQASTEGEARDVLGDYLEEQGLGDAAAMVRESLNLPLPRRVLTGLRDLMPLDENPRAQLCAQIMSESQDKMIVWCRYKRDVENIMRLVPTLDIGEAVKYDGSVRSADRKIALDRFRDPGDPARVLVVNMHALSQGVTLTIAKTVIYYSQIPSLERRLQSEDRAHRIGQDKSVQIFDLVAKGTVDVKLLDGLRRKFDVAAMVTGDRMREWLADE